MLPLACSPLMDQFDPSTSLSAWSKTTARRPAVWPTETHDLVALSPQYWQIHPPSC